METCISDYDFELYVDPYDASRAVVGDRKGTVYAIVNRLAAGHGDGLDVARLLRAAPAMLRALEVALDAYSPNSHLLGVECNSQQKYAALSIREAIGLALYGSTIPERRTARRTADCERLQSPTSLEDDDVVKPQLAFSLRQLAMG